jgi:hypothetical protein
MIGATETSPSVWHKWGMKKLAAVLRQARINSSMQCALYNCLVLFNF